MLVTRHGIWEIIIGTVVLGVVAVALGFLHPMLSLIVFPVWVWLIAFFRDPERPIPGDPNLYVSPADGVVSDVTPVTNDPLLGGHDGIRVGIFLSVFNVHVNRSPCAGTVTKVVYKKGKFINAMDHNKASSDNESNTIVLSDPAGRPVAVVKQIVGLIARRIVCDAKEGTALSRGDRFGMIKFGSRTELTIPNWLMPDVKVQVGQKVRGAIDIIATTAAPALNPDGSAASAATPAA
ncbi:MAG: phosphatidylserine decarboxylase [Tepidisphaeraceae bacterium]